MRPSPTAPEQPMLLFSAPLRQFLIALLVGASLAACTVALPEPTPTATPPAPAKLHVDGRDQEVIPRGQTVAQALQQAGVELSPFDHLNVSAHNLLRSGMCITVTRVFTEREYRSIPYQVETWRDEFLPPSEGQTVVAGRQGTEEKLYWVAKDGQRMIERALAATRTLTSPQHALEVKGTAGTLTATPFSGTIAYVSKGEAWVMRGDSLNKRPLEMVGTLDGKVFDLSSDGTRLLYTSVVSRDGALNRLSVVRTDLINASPQDIGIRAVRWAGWAPNGDSFAYASAEATESLPGWRANNDLHLVTWPSLARNPLLPPSSAFVYAWWGEEWAWAPDGRQLFYAHGDGIGNLTLAGKRRQELLSFDPLPIDRHEVWLPPMAPSPDGQQMATIVPREGRFSATLLTRRNAATVPVPLEVGPDSELAWSPRADSLAYTVPLSDGTHVLRFAWRDSDGNWQAAADDQMDEIEASSLCWGPDGQELLLLHDRELYLYRVADHTLRPLTAMAPCEQPCWRW